MAARHVPESKDPAANRHLDVTGAALAFLGLAGTTFALIEGPSPGTRVAPIIAGVVGVAALVAFVWVELRSPAPMLPMSVFRSRQFSISNVVTLVVYAALGGFLFLFVVYLQQVLGYSALAAGASMLPITIIMLLLSARAGQLSQRIGPRLPMSLGPAIMAVGLLLMLRIGPGATYLATSCPRWSSCPWVSLSPWLPSPPPCWPPSMTSMPGSPRG